MMSQPLILKNRRSRGGPLAALLLLFALSCPAAAENAVEFRGIVYVSLSALLDGDFLDGTSDLTDRGRTIEVRFGGRRIVRFEEGGDRVRVGDERETTALRSPVLVLGPTGTHYVPVEECAAFFGYACEAAPASALVYEQRRLPLAIEPLRPPHLQTRVDGLRAVRRPMATTRPLEARRNLHASTPAEQLPAGTHLLVRREVRLNGVPHVLATRCDESLETFAIAADKLRDASRDAPLDGTHLSRVLSRLSALAADGAAINHGPRPALPRTVAVTADLCWSLRPYERGFFSFLPRLAARDGQAWVTLFVTGRWMEQHPDEMERLIELSREPGVGVTWALHSWVHPKQRPFMNAFPPQALRDDNLRVERGLLEWGIVPSIFYRFPGLEHDATRLRGILEHDLTSVDCDSWVASMRRNRPPHNLLPADGSILLIHGNGNEAMASRGCTSG